MMHNRVFHFCLATNRQQVAHLCVWVEPVWALTRNSDWGPAVTHFLLCLPLGALEVPCDINVRQHISIWYLDDKHSENTSQRKQAMPIQSVPTTEAHPELVQRSWTRHKSLQAALTPLLDHFLSNWLSVCLSGRFSLSVFWQVRCSSSGAGADESRPTDRLSFNHRQCYSKDMDILSASLKSMWFVSLCLTIPACVCVCHACK